MVTSYLQRFRDSHIKDDSQISVVSTGFGCDSTFYENSEFHQTLNPKDLSVLPGKFDGRVDVNRSLLDHTVNDDVDHFAENSFEKAEVEPDPIADQIENIKKFLSTYINISSTKPTPTRQEKFPSEKSVRSIEWHPSCNFLTFNHENNKPFSGIPRVAILYNNNNVEVFHTAEHNLSRQPLVENNGQVHKNVVPPATLRHPLHSDLSEVRWRPYNLSSLAVVSGKNGVLLWHRLGRQDCKSIATVSTVTANSAFAKTQKLVPSINMHHIWKPPSFVQKGDQIESKVDISWSPTGTQLAVLWYGAIFTVNVGVYSEMHGEYDSVAIARVNLASSPMLWNFSDTDSLMFVADDLGKSRILDVNAPFKIGKPFTYKEMCCYNCPKTGFDSKTKKVANGTWWRNLESKRLPSLEGIFLYHYEGEQILYTIKVFKNSHEDGVSFNEEVRQVLNLDRISFADSAYYANAGPEDTFAKVYKDVKISALTWTDNICLIGSTTGKISIVKTKINHGGVAFEFLQTLAFKVSSPIININIFHDRYAAYALESGEFEYCRINDF